VRVPLVSGGEVTGRVAAADADGVRLVLETAGERTLRFDELGPGRVQVEFNRPSGVADDDQSEDFSNSTSGWVEESQ
jgi:ribosome maturation factor RimP